MDDRRRLFHFSFLFFFFLPLLFLVFTFAPIKMTTNTPSKNPFDSSDLRLQLSRLLTIKDATSCACVSKAWSDTFTSAIWRKIDFRAHPQFANLSTEVIAKHGHHIRTAKNASTLLQITALANPSINQLKELQIRAVASMLPMLHVYAYEIVFKNRASLQNLHLFASTSSIDRQKSVAKFVIPSTFVPLSSAASFPGPSKITTLKIEQLSLTHDDLIDILQGCPALSDLRLPYTSVTGTPSKSFQHMGVMFFGSDCKTLFGPNCTLQPNSIAWCIAPVAETPHTSLLSYFPNLATLYLCNYTPEATIPSAEIKKTILKHCLHLTGFQLEDITGAIVFEFLANISDKVTQLVFRHFNMSMEMINSILLHQNSMTTLMHFSIPGFSFEDGKVAPVTTHSQALGTHLQLVPRRCSRLRVLDLHFFEMEMDAVERGEWTCKGLRTLRVRVMGLDTKDRILKAIELWRAGCRRRSQEKAGTMMVKEEDVMDMPIEARVARHLLKFERLSSVWLGYKTWTSI